MTTDKYAEGAFALPSLMIREEWAELSKASLLAIVVLAILVVPNAYVGGATTTSDPEPSQDILSSFPEVEPIIDSETIDFSEPASNTLGKQMVDVVVFTTDIGELGRVLEGIPYQGVIGTTSYGEMSTPILKVPGWAVETIKALPSTVGVYDYAVPEKHDTSSYEPLSADYPLPTNMDAIYNHKAPEAWARGYRGEGVEIAVVDDGVDFAHPDLRATMARYNVSEIPSETLDTKPWLATYDGWPISFDPTSMNAYFSSGGKAEGNWYANTTSTNDTVWHTVKVDGKNDFWTDGSEKVATDSNSDIFEFVPPENRPDYNLVDLWVTQDEKNWFFGFTSKANKTTMNFGLYIDTGPGGADSDPLMGNLITAITNHTPELAVYMTHHGGQPPGRWDRNDTIENATVWMWTGTDWDSGFNVTDAPINGQFAYGQFEFKKGEGFVEFSLPKTYIGDPSVIFVELFTTGTNLSHAQDTCYEDLNVQFSAPDWSSTPTQLSAFTEVGRDYWHHTYNKPGDRPNFSWPIHYIITGTSKSGQYFFGDHPDENLPQTRILVVDEELPGLYDTVYIDLDHNKDFRNDKPNKKYGKYDTNMTWHPADWTGVGTIYDETAFFDFFDPDGAIRSLSYSPDGTMLASGGEDHSVILWNTATWTIRWSVNLGNGRPVSLAFSPDSSMLAIGYDDASGGRYWIVILNTITGAEIQTLKGHTASVNGLAWSQDGSKLASASSDTTARIWDVATSSYIPLNHPDGVTGVSWWWSGNRIATSCLDGHVRLWNSGSGALVTSYLYGQPLMSVAFNPTGTILATGSSDGNVTLWEVTTGSQWSSIGNSGYGVLSVRFNETGRSLVSTSTVSKDFPFAATVTVWEVLAWDNFYTRAIGSSACHDGSRGYPSHIAVFAPNGTQVVSGCGNAIIKLWDLDLNPQGTLRGHRIGITDYTRWDMGDGIPDISGGTIYFIAQNYYYSQTNSWGTPIPYSDAFKNRNGLDTLYIPANGTLVAFTGALDSEQTHGTLVASSIVGKGVSGYYDSSSTIAVPMDEPTEPQVFGIAPAVKIISIGNVYTSSVFEGWWFTAQGYDGMPNTGDEPQIVANSFGFSSTYEDGWDFYSRFADWITMVYASGKLIFTVSAGNDGNGYGTVTSPGSAAGVITVGASTDFFYRKPSGLEQGPHQSYGDVVPFSGRGPTVLGMPDPDILANGRMAFGSTALNTVEPYNGAIASELWSGTSLSSPTAAGILALTMQAYKQKHGDWPDAATARSLLMSSCDDINYDVYSQGAGFLNADRATKLAASIEGFLVTPSSWTPGNYSGKKYEAFTSLIDPGESETMKFTVKNEDYTQTKSANLSTEIFKKIGETEIAYKTEVDGSGNGLDTWLVLIATSSAIRPSWNVRSPGVYQYSTVNSTLWKRYSLNVTTWLNADLLRITAYTNFSWLDGDNDGVLGGTKDYQYMMDLYDWTWDGVNPVRIHPDAGYTDLNRMSIAHPSANVIQGTAHNPGMRTHDGLVIGIRVFPYGTKDIYFKVTVEYFNKTNWASTVTLDSNSLNIPAGSSATFNATLTVPLGTPIGNYEGAIYVKGNPQRWVKQTEVIRPTPYFQLDHYNIVSIAVKRNGLPLAENTDYQLYPKAGVVGINVPSGGIFEFIYYYDQVVTIPISITVPAYGIIFSWPGGLVPGQDELFGNVLTGGFGGGGQSGDWRFYPTILPEGGLYDLSKSQRFLVRATWDLTLTDVDVFAFGPGGSVIPVGADLLQSRYGPFLVGRNNGGSTVTSLVFTTTGKNVEIASPALAGGLNIIAVHAVHMNGSAHEESIAGEVGVFGLSPNEIKIVTNKLYGSRELHMYSSMPWNGVGAISAGPAPPERTFNEHIKQDNIEGTDFVTILSKGSFKRIVKVKPSALIFSVNISSDQDYTDRPCPDLDLGIFLDGKGGTAPDGIAQPEEFVVYSAGPVAREEVRLIRPAVDDNPATPGIDERVDGAPYIIVVLGYTVPWAPYGTFNMDITLVQGEGFSVEGTTNETVTIVPFEVSKVNLNWVLQGSTPPGRMLGALYVGPADAPLMILVPIEMIIDFIPPVITKFSLIPNIDKNVDMATGRVTNDRRPSFVVEVTDDDRGELDPSGVRVWLDGVDVTTWATISFSYTAHPTSEEQGRWKGSVRIVPTYELSEGPHLFKVSIPDIAGNIAERDYIVVVDTRSPLLVIEGPRTFYTNVSDLVIRGTTEPRATVQLGQESITTEDDGMFSFNIQLSPGRNIFTVKAIDWYAQAVGGGTIGGNTASIEITAILDTEPPTVQASVSPSLITNTEAVMLFGLVNDTAGGVVVEPGNLQVEVNNVHTQVRSDGSFAIWFMLEHEGVNNLDITVTDLAGNTANLTFLVTRDTTPPELVLDDMPGVVSDGIITIRGRTTPGTIVKVNGYDATVEVGGTFYRDVQLSAGMNVIVVRADDIADNVIERRIGIYYTSEYMPEAGGSGGYLGISPIAWAAILIVLGIVLGFILYFLFIKLGLFKKGPKAEEEAEVEAPPEEKPLEEEEVEEPVPEEKVTVPEPEPREEVMKPKEAPPPTEEVPKPPEDVKVERLRKAFEEGKISEEVYKQNLARLGVAVPPPQEPQPVEDPKIQRLRKAYEDGKISKEVYEENLKKLKGGS